jgi:hypothetical protein
MWQLEAQGDQGDQHPIGGDQPVVGAGSGSTAARMASALPQGALVGGGGPRVGKLVDHVGEVLPGQPGDDPVGEGRRAHAGVNTHA